MGVAPPAASVCRVCGDTYTSLALHTRGRPRCSPTTQVVPQKRARSLVTTGGLGQLLAGDELHEQVLWDLGGMRMERNFRNQDVAFVKEKASHWFNLKDEAGVAALSAANMLRDGVSEANALATLQSNPFDGIQTTKLEDAAQRQRHWTLEPRVVDLSGRDCRDADHLVVSFSVLALLEQRLKQDKEFRLAVLAKSDKWKQGNEWRQAPHGTLTDFDDATRARFHPHLMRPATPEEADDVRIALEFNADDIEVCARTRRAPTQPYPAPSSC